MTEASMTKKIILEVPETFHTALVMMAAASGESSTARYAANLLVEGTRKSARQAVEQGYFELNEQGDFKLGQS